MVSSSKLTATAITKQSPTLKMADATTITNRSTHPPFPEPGSIIKDRYFCLGRLGKGTFCAVSFLCIAIVVHDMMCYTSYKYHLIIYNPILVIYTQLII